ncbi:receptor-like protein EIX2 [Senna tora]|uniref:Receptor-like protein EIX2 n=1 Tax=Senna tora TaxID=362788 RepID=A0A834WMI5_9FABA|nr:receptor-like protein EIX2 [Senna tora]
MRISYESLVFGFVLLFSECSTLWFMSEINASSSSSSIFCIEHERQALLKFKASFKDPSTSYRLSTWKGRDCCQWQDFEYDMEADEVNPSLLKLKYLSYLDLSGKNFHASPVPMFLGSMKQLTHLFLSRSNFSGSIPHNLGNLTNLVLLDLRGIRHLQIDDGIQWISQLQSLQHLDMSYVNLSKAHTLFQVLNMLPSLLQLHLRDCELDNFLESPFLNAFQNMTSLRVLDLSRNNLNSTPLWLEKCNHLVELHLSGNKLDGSIPNALRNLTSLAQLDLSFNNFISPIPSWFFEIYNCNLRVLDLSGNKFSGHLPSWLGKFDKLRTIDLSSNSFIGPIPSSLGNLSNLVELWLSGNHLNGTIPDSFIQLVNLRSLHLEDNNLDGVFPDFLLRDLLSLNKLSLSNNNFHGVLPANTIGQLVNLTSLNLSFNRFHGNIPKSLEKLVNLEYLDLSYNHFSGVIPQSLGQLVHLDIVFLRRNNLQGNIPESFDHIRYLDLSSNALEGSISKLNFSAQSCFYLDLSDNHITGQLPENISDLMPNLLQLFLGKNLINGSIPKSLCKMENLYNLDLSKNKLSGEIPNCWRKGQSSCVINLSSNKLTGAIPSSIGNLDSLASLHLNDNSLQGELPLSMKNLKNLMVLDLGENQFSGTIPTWMMDSCPLLHILRLRQNNFSGNIPSQLCQLSRLQILDLGSNNLLGPIPDCIGNLNAMAFKNSSDNAIMPLATSYRYFELSLSVEWNREELKQVMKGRELDYTSNLQFLVNLDLSNNNFSGSIPEGITALTGLQGLNLSHNHLFGEIPERIGDMKSLESIDFSQNHLSGTIPNSMSKLTGLGHMNLSYNNLSGKIPRESQLLTLDNPLFYIGNPYLCGEPLQKKCPGEEVDQALAESNGEEDEDGKHDDLEKIWFYFVVAVGYATGFWISIGLLFFKKNWRHAYFRWGEKVADKIYVSIALKAAKVKKMMEGNSVDE